MIVLDTHIWVWWIHGDARLTTTQRKRLTENIAVSCLRFGIYFKEKPMKRKASAVWQGGLKDGKGTISTESGVLENTQYSFSTRFEDGKGTNPEELIAAAHAGCFSMALSGQLGNAGMTAESINTTATLTLEKTDAGFTVTKVHLDVTARIPGAEQAAFETAANNAKAGCPISRLLKAEITMDARLEAASGA
jgi:lipoyl-dependent peroxiredoxin